MADQDSSSSPPPKAELPADILEIKAILDKPWVNPQQVGDLLGAKYNTVMHWIRDGKLKTTRIGGRHRIYADMLRDFLKLEGYQDVLEAAEANIKAKEEAADGT